MLSAGFWCTELVPRQDIHDDCQNGDAGDSDGVDDNSFVDHPAVSLHADAEESLLSKSSEASTDAKYEGKDSEGGVDGYQGGTETSSSLIADQQQQEAEEADSVLYSKQSHGDKADPAV